MTEPSDGKSAEGTVAARERAAALIGRTISERYKIVELIAMGGMGAVYRAEHLLMRKQVAVKVLHPEAEDFPELVERFEREAVAGAHIQHPNVATASDFGKFDGESRFLVLELIRGVTLSEFMKRGPISANRTAQIIRQAAAALAAVHQKGIVHRDVKPRNIMIIDETRRTRRLGLGSRGAMDSVKLIDFGLSKVPVDELSAASREPDDGERRSLTAAGIVMGTIGYIAPEAALGMPSVLAPADLYSLGVIFYEMLCGKVLFDAVVPKELFAQHCHEPVPALAERNPEVSVPPEMEAIVRRLLEKDPGRRYPSAEALVEALDIALGPDSIGPASAPAQRAKPESSQPAAAPAQGARPVTARSERSEVNAFSRKMTGSRRTGWIFAGLVAVAGIVAAVAASGTGEPAASDSSAPSSARAESPSSPAISSRTVTAAPPRAPSVVQRLRAAAEAHNSAVAAAVFIELADKERAAFGDRAVQTEAAGVAEVAAASGQAADPIFDRLANQLGTDGLDILYDLAARESRASDPLERTGIARPLAAGPRARALLGRPDGLARATPAMRIAYELQRASCQQRLRLFPLAAKDGDDRALAILTAMQPPACSARSACCFTKHRELERAIAEIQTRLRH